MAEKIQIITTGDGSHSLLNTELNETYHSVHGARRESLHVFIKHGLDFFCERSAAATPVRILEIGFGTGLNALLTIHRASETQRVLNYTTLEAFPLEASIWSSLNYTEDVFARELFERIHLAPWAEQFEITPFFSLHKLHATLQQISLAPFSFDVIFFDAFAPNKQPELWQISLLDKVVTAMKPGGVFVTYCAKGQLKRDLKSLNLVVETLEGPPGKKEMVRALKS
jgi:tRNA U34 5-methylaminomethyl-2-thiouridine-forming methyltransferase MnmC